MNFFEKSHGVEKTVVTQDLKITKDVNLETRKTVFLTENLKKSNILCVKENRFPNLKGEIFGNFFGSVGLMSFLKNCGKDLRFFRHCVTFRKKNIRSNGTSFTFSQKFRLEKRFANLRGLVLGFRTQTFS